MPGNRPSLRQSLVLLFLELQEHVLGRLLPLVFLCRILFSLFISCPTECRLTNVAAPARWNCVVSIRTITDSTGQHLGQARNEPFGEVIYNKAEVEDRIRRAQRAILNPHIPRSQILMGDEEINDGRTFTFSSNYVSLQISGPDVADLSFCDLPGLYSSLLFHLSFLLSVIIIPLCRSHSIHQRGKHKRHCSRRGFGRVVHKKAQLHHPSHCFMRE